MTDPHSIPTTTDADIPDAGRQHLYLIEQIAVRDGAPDLELARRAGGNCP